MIDSTVIMSVQVRGCRREGLLTSASGGWFGNSSLVERDGRRVEETGAHLRIWEPWLFREIVLAVGIEGGGKGRDRVSQGREFHFLDRDHGGIILHVGSEEYVFVLHLTRLAH